MEINYEHLAHIIRDVFAPEGKILHLGEDTGFRDIMESSEHSVETWGINFAPQGSNTHYRTWNPANNPYYSYDSMNLIFSYNYNPPPGLWSNSKREIALKLQRLLEVGGFMLLVNPGDWATYIGGVSTRWPKTEQELKRYSILAEQDVRVYNRWS